MHTNTDATKLPTVVFFPGAGKDDPLTPVLVSTCASHFNFIVISYPNWRDYVFEGADPRSVVDDAVDKIERSLPNGPVLLVGYSIGGHFAYSAAIELCARNRGVASVMPIDSYMRPTVNLNRGSWSRFVKEGVSIVGSSSFGAMAEYAFVKLFRLLLRLVGPNLKYFLRRLNIRSVSFAPSWLRIRVSREIALRLLILESVDWLAELDRDPKLLSAPTEVFRTSQNSIDDGAWRRRCSNLSIHEVPGTHNTISESANVTILSSALIEAISKCLETPDGGAEFEPAICCS